MKYSKIPMKMYSIDTLVAGSTMPSDRRGSWRGSGDSGARRSLEYGYDAGRTDEAAGHGGHLRATLAGGTGGAGPESPRHSSAGGRGLCSALGARREALRSQSGASADLRGRPPQRQRDHAFHGGGRSNIRGDDPHRPTKNAGGLRQSDETFGSLLPAAQRPGVHHLEQSGGGLEAGATPL